MRASYHNETREDFADNADLSCLNFSAKGYRSLGKCCVVGDGDMNAENPVTLRNLQMVVKESLNESVKPY